MDGLSLRIDKRTKGENKMDKKNNEVVIPAEVRAVSTEDQDITIEAGFKFKS